MPLSRTTQKFKTLRRREGRQPASPGPSGSAYAPVAPGASSSPPGPAYAPTAPSGGNGALGPGYVQPPLAPAAAARAQLTGSATQDDIVIYRLNSWRTLVKAYTEYFTAFAAAQKSVKKVVEKSAGDFEMPLSGEHYFAGIEYGGVQRLGIQLREMHDMYSAHASRLIQGIEADTLSQLDELRTEIKGCLKIYTDSLGPAYRRLRKQAKEVEACKEKLARAVEAHERKGRGPDVWLVRQQVRRELATQAGLENSLHRAMQAELGRLLGWETIMSARLRDIIAGVVAGERASIHACSETADNCGVLLDRFDATTEARAFDYHFGATLRAPLGLTGYSSLESYDYMYRDCRVADVLMEGPLERERGMIKRFQPTHVVLTAQGYLHCYADPTHLLEKSPDLSLNLATCAVMPLDDPHMFVVVASDKKLGRSRYAFRGPNPAATGHWVSAISSVAARQSTPPTPVASNTMRDAPAALEQELDDFSIASDDYEEPEPMYDDPPAAARSLDIDSNAPAAAAAAEAAAPLEEQTPEASVPEGLAPGQASQVAMPEPQVLTLNILEEDAAPLPTASMAMAAPLPTSGMSMAAALPTSGMSMAAPLPTSGMSMAAPLPTASMAMAAALPTASTATTNPLLGAPGGSGPGGGPGDVDARLLHPMPPPLGSAFPPGPF